MIYIYDANFANASDFSIWAGSSDAVIVYHCTPTTTQRTTHDIPALVGVNTLYGDGDSIAVKGRQPKVNAFEARLAALEAAAVKA